MEPKLLVIIPAHNEEQNLPALFKRLSAFRSRYDTIVIDDCSQDRTADVASSFGSPVIRLAANLGIGGAVQTGFKYALAGGYSVTVQLDGDGQHDPQWLDAVVAPVLGGDADCVIGSRYLGRDRDPHYVTPFARRLGMRFSTALLFAATGLRITDTTSGYRALNRRAFEYFAHNYPVDHPEAEALLLLHRKGFRIKEVPISMLQRCSGKSQFTIFRSALYPFRLMIGFACALLRRS